MTNFLVAFLSSSLVGYVYCWRAALSDRFNSLEKFVASAFIAAWTYFLFAMIAGVFK